MRSIGIIRDATKERMDVPIVLYHMKYEGDTIVSWHKTLAHNTT